MSGYFENTVWPRHLTYAPAAAVAVTRRTRARPSLPPKARRPESSVTKQALRQVKFVSVPAHLLSSPAPADTEQPRSMTLASPSCACPQEPPAAMREPLPREKQAEYRRQGGSCNPAFRHGKASMRRPEAKSQSS